MSKVKAVVLLVCNIKLLDVEVLIVPVPESKLILLLVPVIFKSVAPLTNTSPLIANLSLPPE